MISSSDQILLTLLNELNLYTNDRSLLKLLLIISSLSSDINRYQNDASMDCIYDDTLSIFAAQNVYVELLWRYLLTRFASEFDAVRFYSKFIRDFLILQRVCMIVDSHINNLTHKIQQMKPLIQSMRLVSHKPSHSNTNAVKMTSFS